MCGGHGHTNGLDTGKGLVRTFMYMNNTEIQTNTSNGRFNGLTSIFTAATGRLAVPMSSLTTKMIAVTAIIVVAGTTALAPAALTVALVLGFASPASASPLSEQFALDAQAGSFIYGSPTSGPDLFAIAAYVAPTEAAAVEAPATVDTTGPTSFYGYKYDPNYEAPAEAITVAAPVEVITVEVITVDAPVEAITGEAVGLDDAVTRRAALIQSLLASGLVIPTPTGATPAATPAVTVTGTAVNMVCTDIGEWFPAVKLVRTTTYSDGTTSDAHITNVPTPFRRDMTRTVKYAGQTWTISDVDSHAALGELLGFDLCQLQPSAPTVTAAVTVTGTAVNMVCTDIGEWFPAVTIVETTTYSDGTTSDTPLRTVNTPARRDVTVTYTYGAQTWTISDVRTHAHIGHILGFDLCQLHS
jgi:hypothetical protein